MKNTFFRVFLLKHQCLFFYNFFFPTPDRCIKMIIIVGVFIVRCKYVRVCVCESRHQPPMTWNRLAPAGDWKTTVRFGGGDYVDDVYPPFLCTQQRRRCSLLIWYDRLYAHARVPIHTVYTYTIHIIIY